MLNISCTVAVVTPVLLLFLYGLLKKRRSRDKKKTPYRKIIVNKNARGKVRVLVTGGNGCLGRALIEELVKDGGYLIHSLDLSIPNEENRNPEVYAYIQVNILDAKGLEQALTENRVEAVFHVAGIIPEVGVSDEYVFQVNEIGTKNIVEQSKLSRVKRFIYTSSSAVVVSSDLTQVLDMADEDTPYPDHPANAYTGSKMKAERAVVEANGWGDMLTCTLRPCNIFADDAIACHSMLKLRRVFCIGSGQNKFNLVFAPTCAKGHILAEKKLREGPLSVAAGRIYNLGSRNACKCMECLSYTLDKESGLTVWGLPAPKPTPKWVISILVKVNVLMFMVTGKCLHRSLSPILVDMAVREFTFSSARAYEELGWKEETWQEVVLQTVEQYKKKLK